MQMARRTVTKEESDVLKNFELICYCDHRELCFWSGSKEHQVKVQMDKDADKVEITTTRKTWNEYLQVVVQNAWDFFKGVIITFSGEMPSVTGQDLEKLVWHQVLENK